MGTKTAAFVVALIVTVVSCFNKQANDPKQAEHRDASSQEDSSSKVDKFLEDSMYEFVDVNDTSDDCSGDFTPPAVKQGEPVLLIGDSLGVGLSTEFLKIAKSNGYKPVAHVVSGTTTKFWAKAVLRDIEVHRPSLVVVSLGTNDAVNTGFTQKTYEDFAVALNDVGTFVVWIGPPAIKASKIAKIEKTREEIRSSVPNFFESENIEIPLLDGIHSTGQGYAKWMRAVWQWMADLGIVSND